MYQPNATHTARTGRVTPHLVDPNGIELSFVEGPGTDPRLSSRRNGAGETGTRKGLPLISVTHVNPGQAGGSDVKPQIETSNSERRTE